MYTLSVVTTSKTSDVKSSIRPSIEQFSHSLIKIVTADEDGVLETSYLNVAIVQEISVKDV